MAKKVKMKTHKGAAKRFKIKSSGKIKRKKAFLQHGMRKRTSKVKRVLRQKGLVSKADSALIERMLPYG